MSGGAAPDGAPVAGDAATTRDALLSGRLAVTQPRRGYRSAIDPVLLAAAQDAAEGERIVDLGCGAGVVMLCLLARLPAVRVVGVERDPFLAELARRNLADNGFAQRGRVITADLADSASLAAAVGRADRVVTNPPYHAADNHTLPAEARARAAGHEDDLGLPAWLDAAGRLVAPRGRLSLIHRADRLVDLVRALPKGFGSAVLLPLWPRAGAPAKRLIATARKGGRGPTELAPGLVLHRPDGTFTAAAEATLRDGAALEEAAPQR